MRSPAENDLLVAVLLFLGLLLVGISQEPPCCELPVYDAVLLTTVCAAKPLPSFIDKPQFARYAI